jgi:hypothetical protein
MEIKLREYSSKTHQFVETGEKVSTYTLAHSMTEEQLAELLADYANCNGFTGTGAKVGRHLTTVHRHLQAVVVSTLIYILNELGKQTYFDARNEHAVETCKELSKWLEDNRNYYFGR